MSSILDGMQLPGMLVRVGSKLKVIQLQHGSHSQGMNKGVCVMEAVSALWPGQNHTDGPACVSNPIMNLGISINDGFSSTSNRQILWKFVPKFMGTDQDGLDAERAKVGRQWLAEHKVDIHEGYTLQDVTHKMLTVIKNTVEGEKRVEMVDSALSALMPHEPPSLAKLQWENLQATYGQDVDPEKVDVSQYAQAGMAVAI